MPSYQERLNRDNFAQSEPGLSAKDVAGFGRKNKLLRELSSLENGPIADLEKANTERKHLLAKAGMVLEKLVATATANRLEMKRRDEAAAGSKDTLEATRKRVIQVRRESGFARRTILWTIIQGGGVITEGNICVSRYQALTCQFEERELWLAKFFKWCRVKPTQLGIVPTPPCYLRRDLYIRFAWKRCCARPLIECLLHDALTLPTTTSCI